MTLRPNPTVANNLTPLTKPSRWLGLPLHLLINIVGNVAVFVPLGTAAALALTERPITQRLLLGATVGAALSAAIELMQIALPSRASRIGDWALNTTGAAIGALTGCILTGTYRVLREKDKQHATTNFQEKTNDRSIN